MKVVAVPLETPGVIVEVAGVVPRAVPTAMTPVVVPDHAPIEGVSAMMAVAAMVAVAAVVAIVSSQGCRSGRHRTSDGEAQGQDPQAAERFSHRLVSDWK